MASDINRTILTARLTQDPKLWTSPSGFAICTLRVASNTTRKDGASGEFVEKPNYFDVKVLGKQGENAAKYLKKGSPIAVDGRLEWREYTTNDNQPRQAVELIVDMHGSLRFLSSPGERSGGSNGGGGADSSYEASYDAPASGGNDDLPF
jgi:single-strand DNA-binding protein